ncbi:MAG TPA: porin family protein [Sulfurovum sp.]|nr:porin family protein [Sulfurovum sp.]
MKKIVLSAVAVAAMSTFAIAGGDIAPIEEEVVVVEPVVTDSGFYLGLAYSYLSEDYTRTPTRNNNFDSSISALMLQAGYKYNEYIAVEGRYWYGRGSDLDINRNKDVAGPNSWALYAKPMYPVTDAIDVYALLGYAQVEQNTIYLNTLDGFSWGLGTSYDVMENVALFVDYTSLYNGDYSTNNFKKDYDINTWNFGVTYNF